jgi:hypothetical protein
MNAVTAVNIGSSVRLAARTFDVKISTGHLLSQNLKNSSKYSKYETKQIISHKQEKGS